ncbi:MAG: T9SS type A sorting domain-containing protein [Ferruginibacter sp.]
MKQMRYLSILLLAVLSSTTQSFSQSTSWKGTTNANWNVATNWTNGIPDATKDAILGDANFTGINQPKVNVAGTCKSVTIGGAVATTLTTTRALTMSGNFTINANGTVIHPGATHYVAGNFTNNGTYTATATSSRFIFNGTNQTIAGTSPIAFRLVTINLGSTVSLATNCSVTGASSNLTVNGTIDPGQSPAYTLSSTGITKLYGTLKVYTANFTSNYSLTGTTTIYAGAVVDYASTTGNQTISSAYSYSTLMISGSGTKSLAANLPNLYGRASAYGKIIVSTGTTLDLGAFTANRATNSGGGELNIANGGIMKVGGINNFPANFSTRTFGASSTVEYNGVDQTISAQAYGNLLISTAGIKTATTAFSTTGDLKITNGTFNTNTTVVTHSIAGNFTMSGGSITGTNYTFSLNGGANQTLDLISPISKLTINNIGGTIVLASDITINTTLNFIHGNIQTGSYNVIVPTTGSVTGAGQSTGWVSGNLQKNVTTGVGVVRSFEIGATSYSPVTIFFSSVSIAGTLTATVNSIDHSEIDYSGINPVKDVNRYWSFNNSGILFTTATTIFNWTATDIDGGATTTNFKTGLYNGASWTLPTSNTALPTSIQATGVTALGDFCVGEIIGRSTWTGAALTSNWFTPKNWLGLVPSTAYPTTIPNGLLSGRVYPVINSGTGTVGDITVDNAATLTVSSGTLQIAGTITSVANINATAGTIEFNGSSAQSIPTGSFTSNTIKNLTISNNVSLDASTIVTGTVTVANAKTFVTNDNLVLKSDANGTARVAALPVDGSGNATAFITGKVSIERYIPARKAWRLLSAPIATTTTTLQDAWQENAYPPSALISNPNPNPGYGVHLCGGTNTNGFDQSPTNAATIKVWNPATGFVPLPATPGTYVPLNTYSGYLVYIRGDRGIDLSLGNNAPVTSTTLRMKGDIKTGKQTATVNAFGFTVVGNPYPSAIDFATLTRNNVKNSFFIWDPKLTGSNGLGAYVTVSWNSGTNSYDVTTSASPISQYIPSGEAILVQSLDSINNGSIVIKETDKTANGSDFQFGRPTSLGQKLRANLYEQNADGSSSLLDGTLTTYDDNNSNHLDNSDVKKMITGGESIGILREASVLSIERRKTIASNDTSFLSIAEMKQKNYKLEIITERFEKPGFTAVLKDKFSSQLNNTVLNANGTTEILFSVTDNPASYAADRFSIVFSKAGTAVFAFKSVKATLQQKNVSVEWQTENESAISNYEVEGSADGTKFTKLSALTSKAGSGSSYSWFDLNASAGDHYYRIKSSGVNGDKKYSSTVKVTIAGTTVAEDSKQLIVYPNPVKNNASLQLAFLERGMYIIEITNINGQMVKRLSIVHNGGTFKYNFPVDGNLRAGKYQLKLTDGGNVNYITSMIKE